MLPFKPSLLALASLTLWALPASAQPHDADLIPVRFEEKAGPPMSQLFLKDNTFLFHSEGDPIEFEIRPKVVHPGTAEWTMTLSNRNGEVIEESTFGAEEERTFKIAVPAPGLYSMNLQCQNQAWQIIIPPTQHAVLQLAEGHHVGHTGELGRRFFYVPKGTREITFYAGESCLKLPFLDSTGELVQEIVAEGSNGSVEVPEGEDGTVWSIGRGFRPGEFWFTNLPNYLAVSPYALLIPREIVEKDGLNPE